MKTLLIALMMMSGSAMAEWTLIAGTQDETIKYYLDFSTIKKSGKKTNVWVLVDYKTPQGEKPNIFRSSKVLKQYYCGKAKVRMISLFDSFENMGKGKITSALPHTSWVHLPPDSVGIILMKRVCGVVI